MFSKHVIHERSISQNLKEIIKIMIMMIFTDLSNHDFMICNKSFQSFFVGRVKLGPGTCYPDAWNNPDRGYDLVFLLVLIGINYCCRPKKRPFNHRISAIRIENPGYAKQNYFSFSPPWFDKSILWFLWFRLKVWLTGDRMIVFLSQ